MQASVWYNYLEKVNKIMRQQNRNILLLADNAPTHIVNENLPLSNVKLHFLPPNTTSHLQSLDAGIINSFKVRNKKKFEYFINFRNFIQNTLILGSI
jgi:hypothetical protein